MHQGALVYTTGRKLLRDDAFAKSCLATIRRMVYLPGTKWGMKTHRRLIVEFYLQLGCPLPGPECPATGDGSGRDYDLNAILCITEGKQVLLPSLLLLLPPLPLLPLVNAAATTVDIYRALAA